MGGPPMAPVDLMAMPGNYSRVEMEGQEPVAGAFDVGMVSAFVAAAITAVIGSLMHIRHRTICAANDNNEYEELQDDAPIVKSQ